MVYKYWPQHLLSTRPARGTDLCHHTPRHGWDEVLSCSDKAMDCLPCLQHCLPGNTFLLPALQMLRPFPEAQSRHRMVIMRLVQKKKKRNTAFCKQVEKKKWGEEELLFRLSSLIFPTPQHIPKYNLLTIIGSNSQIMWMSKSSASTFPIKTRSPEWKR